MSIKRIALAIVVASVVSLAVGASIEVAARASLAESRNSTIPYAGRLNDETGQPVVEGSYAFTFALYDAPTGGQPLWSEVQESVMVKEGSFAISLGSVNPIPPTAMDGETLWLAVGVRGSGEAGFTALAPRQRVSAAAPASAAANGACPHDHLGETWTGTEDSLTITGDFGSGESAPLVLSNAQSGGRGLRVTQGGDAGVSVGSANFGLVVEAADADGVSIDSAGDDGVSIGTSGDDGMYVGSAGSDGLHVRSATNMGAYVESARTGFGVNSVSTYGMYVGNSGSDGLHIISTGYHGMYVGSADGDGVYVYQADGDGVRVGMAGGNGVFAVSGSDLFYGGVFYNSAPGGAGLYAAGGNNAAPDLVLGVYGNGDDGRIYSDPGLAGSDLLLFSNDEVHIHLDEDNDEIGTFVIYDGENYDLWTVGEKGEVTFGTQAGAYGPRAAYPVRATGDWIEDFGTAELADGQASVTIEPVYAQTVNLTEYQVFLTPLGDCPLYVAAKTPASFTVKAMGGQRCSIAFDYRLVAKRLGNEAARLEPASVSDEGDDD
ncbi:MAG: hypothetical protein JXM73_24630 [Anaerolineae bacterium]|nr:hypothetical protein [Anaerolineae bacterium]